MSTELQENAVTHRLDKMRKQWHDFRQKPETQVYIWSVIQDELSMVDAFVHYENSEYGATPDYIFSFNTNFSDSETYHQNLVSQFRTYVEEKDEEGNHVLQAQGVDTHFNYPTDFKSPDSIITLWEELALGLKKIGLPGNLVIRLQPEQIASFKLWQTWWDKLIGEGIPQHLCFLLVESPDYPAYDHWVDTYPATVKRITADLDMIGAMEELASEGDMTDPGVQFRLLFLELGKASGQQDFEEVERIGQKAFHLAQAQVGWEHLQIAVLEAMASAYLAAKNLKRALLYNEKSLEIALAAYDDELEAAPVLLAQTHMFKASTLMMKGDFEAAAQTYEATIPFLGQDPKTYFNKLEAWRMAGLAYEKDKQNRKAWACNLEALHTASEIAETMPEASPPEASPLVHTPLHCVGQALLRLMENLGHYEYEETIQEQLNHFVGPNWQEKPC